MRYILDSDTLSLLENGHERVVSKVAERQVGEVAISVITVDESLRGWFSLVRKAKNRQQLAFAYDRLARSVSFLSNLQILPFTEAAIGKFDELRKSKLQVRANDLRIAAIALELNGVVVTRNMRDFLPVPGLSVVDWSKS